MLAASLNLCFLVVLPVTIDRSISVFLLGEMAAHPDRSYSAADLRTLFKDTYVDGFQQIERRVDEQERSGNIRRVGAGYEISPQGRAFVHLSADIASAVRLAVRRRSRAGSSTHPSLRASP